MTSVDNLSPEDKDFLAKCEEQLKHRYTDKDEEFMKVFNAEPSTPPIIEAWWIPNNSGRRNDRRNNSRHSYEQKGHGNRDRDRNYHDRRDWDNRRGYNDYNRGYNSRGYDNNRGYDRGHDFRSKQPRY